jgi:Trypsin-like peptidase domain
MLHDLSIWDLEFLRVPVTDYTARGFPFERWIRVGMPRIPPQVINSVFYLYRTRADAKAGKDPGGTGFLVHYDGYGGTVVRRGQVYAVTNWHVACRGHSVVRVNTKDGEPDIFDFGPEDWHFLPGKYDVAVVPISLKIETHNAAAIPTTLFSQPDRGLGQRAAVGDDVFMIGLFIDHDGVTTNVPSARFGNVSMLPNPAATIEQETGYRGESYVVDMHSRTGFSGSPVFVYRTFGSDLTTDGFYFDDLRIDHLQERLQPNSKYGGPMAGRMHVKTMFRFLGIHWGQFPEKLELRKKSRSKDEVKNNLIIKGHYVEGMSGMTCVVPAWDILEVFEMKEVKAAREAFYASTDKGMKPKAESSPPASDENPTAREDFTRLVGVAARKRPQDD